MSGRLPRYQPLGVSREVPRSLDLAHFREQAKSASSYVGALGQIDAMAADADNRLSQMATFFARTDAKQKLAQAQADAQTVKLAASQVETDALMEMDKAIAIARQQRSNPSAVEEGLRNIVDGYAATLSNLDPETATELRSRLYSAAGQRMGPFYGQYTRDTANDIQESGWNGVNVRQTAIFDTARQGGDVGEQTNALLEHMRASLFDEAQVEKIRAETEKRVVTESIWGTFSRLQTEQERSEFLTALNNNPPPLLGSRDTDILTKRLRTTKERNATVVKSNVGALRDELSGYTSIVNSGGVVDGKALLELKTKIQSLPQDQLNGLDHEMEKLEVIIDYSDIFMSLNPVQLQDQVHQLEKEGGGIKGKGGPGLDTDIEIAVRNTATQILNTMQAALINDPLSWANKAKLIEVRPITEQSDPGDIDARIKQGFLVQNHYYSPLKFLTNEEASALSVVFNEGDFAGKKQVVTQISQSFGNLSDDVFAQLSNNNQILAYVGGLYNNGLANQGDRVLMGMERIKNGPPIDGMASGDKRAEEAFLEEIDGALLQTPKMNSSIRAAARAYYASEPIALGEFDDKQLQYAVQLVAGYDEGSGTGGFQEVRRRTTLLPPGFDRHQVDDLLDDLTPEQLRENTGLTDINPALVKQISDDKRYKLMAAGGLGKYFVVVQNRNTIHRVVTESGEDVIIDILKLSRQ